MTGLEALDTIRTLNNLKNGLDRRCFSGALDIIEKELKALEIVRKKRVDVRLLDEICNDTHDTYNQHYEERYGCMRRKIEDNNYLTEQEYDLLMEVLGK